MPSVLSVLLRMSVQGTFLILALLAMSALLGERLSPRLRYALWLLPALRLIVPFSFETPLSIRRAAASPAPAAMPEFSPAAPALPEAGIAAPAPAAPSLPDAAPAPAAPSVDWGEALLLVWLLGVALVLGYTLFLNLRFYRRVRATRAPLDLLDDPPVYRADWLPSPCLAGLIRPCILVNAAACAEPDRLALILAHERAHLRQGDPWWTLLRTLICAFHWFNPLVWWAAFRSRRDCEMACDFLVMQGFSPARREQYGMALLAILRGERAALGKEGGRACG